MIQLTLPQVALVIDCCIADPLFFIISIIYTSREQGNNSVHSPPPIYSIYNYVLYNYLKNYNFIL